MPDRYWVGGTANWDGTAGTKWSATSGGPGGASVPTAADDVFFTNLSTGTCTITLAANAKSINCTGFTGTLAGSAALTVAGSVTLSAAMTHTYLGSMTITGTGTVTSAGKTLAAALIINGAGITVGLGDALNLTSTLTVTQGTFNTNNFNVTAGGLSSSNTTVRTINLGSSTVSIFGSATTAINFLTPTNLTFNAGTSQVNLTAANTGIVVFGSSLTFNNISFTFSTPTINQRVLDGTFIINNLTLTAVANGTSSLAFSSNCTITGTLTCSGAGAAQRASLRSSSTGAARTLTVGTLLASNCDFRDITLAGAASPASPANAGDLGGNTNITFPAPKTVYRVGTDTTWIGNNSWALSSGGTGSDANFPLAQDTAVIDDNTALTGTLELGVINTNINVGTFDCSSRTAPLTYNLISGVSMHGSYTLGSGISVASSAIGMGFTGRSAVTITTAGRTINHNITFSTPGTSVTLLDAFLSLAAVTLGTGTFNLNGFSLTCGSFSSNNSLVRTLAAGSNSSITLTGTSGSPWFTSTTTNLSITGTLTITFTASTTRSFNSGTFNFPATVVNGGTGALSFVGGNHTFIGLSNTVTPTSFFFQAGTTTTLTNWNINGTPGNPVTIGSSTAASHTLSKASGTVTGDYLSISRSNATGGATWNATNSTDGGNNTGWNFGGGPPPPPTPSPSNFFLFFGEG